MTCFHPLTAYRLPGGGITFKEGGEAGAALELPCGRCIGCRKKRTTEWATRIMHEASMHDQNSFITLTYDESNENPGLNYADFQKFMRRMRKRRARLGQSAPRYYACGEYGDQTKRPHWHAILFGIGFERLYPVGKDLYGSHDLDELWGKGFATIGEVNWTTAGYVASYCIKKITGPAAPAAYTRINTATGELVQVQPEMARMSLKPGIGEAWIKKYWREVYLARDGIIKPGGLRIHPPRYYDKKINEWKPELQIERETNRQLKAIESKEDNTRERLKIKEQIAIANQKAKKQRTL